jgi:hypothetical protein
MGDYYKPIFMNREIREFLNGIKNIKQVELFLYTDLHKSVAEELLKKMGINQFFSVENRKFLEPEHPEIYKHAIEVDKDSRRVIIITPNKHDHSE